MNESEADKIKNDLLRGARDGNVMEFTQLDWIHMPDEEKSDDGFIALDEDKDALLYGHTTDLRRSPDILVVRMQISKPTTRETVIRVLKKTVDWLENTDEKIMLSELVVQKR